METPKEKAIELVDTFMKVDPIKLSDYSKIYYPTAKQCALIAVDEIIKITRSYAGKDYDYYLEVKQEIIKL